MPKGTTSPAPARPEGTARKRSREQSVARTTDRRPLLTVEETAAILGVTRQTIARLRARGELRSIQVGRAVRIHPSDLDRYLGVDDEVAS